MLHIKGNETYSNIQTNNLPLHLHTFNLWDGVKRSKHFPEGGHVHIKLKGMKHGTIASKKNDITHTLTSGVGFKTCVKQPFKNRQNKDLNDK